MNYVIALDSYSITTKMVMGAILASLAAIFQSVGVFVGIGYVVSILTTWPIVVATVLTFRMGFMTYILTILLLAIIQPSELFVFPFTTGLLGLSLGLGLRVTKSGPVIVAFAATTLTLGILVLLYALRFPILGPSITSEIDVRVILCVFVFSSLYSWLWLRLSIYGLKTLHRVVQKKPPNFY